MVKLTSLLLMVLIHVELTRLVKMKAKLSVKQNSSTNFIITDFEFISGFYKYFQRLELFPQLYFMQDILFPNKNLKSL